jgi:hypothetical protein
MTGERHHAGFRSVDWGNIPISCIHLLTGISYYRIKFTNIVDLRRHLRISSSSSNERVRADKSTGSDWSSARSPNPQKTRKDRWWEYQTCACSSCIGMNKARSNYCNLKKGDNLRKQERRFFTVETAQNRYCIHGLAGLAISGQTLVKQRYHTMLWDCCGSSAHSTEKPIASAISPWEAMTKVKSAFANPANPWLYLRCRVFRFPGQTQSQLLRQIHIPKLCKTTGTRPKDLTSYGFRIRMWGDTCGAECELTFEEFQF